MSGDVTGERIGRPGPTSARAVRPGTGLRVRLYIGLLASALLALIGWLAWDE